MILIVFHFAISGIELIFSHFPARISIYYYKNQAESAESQTEALRKAFKNAPAAPLRLFFSACPRSKCLKNPRLCCKVHPEVKYGSGPIYAVSPSCRRMPVLLDSVHIPEALPAAHRRYRSRRHVEQPHERNFHVRDLFRPERLRAGVLTFIGSVRGRLLAQ